MQHGPAHASCEQGISACRAVPKAAAVNKMRQNHCRTFFLFSVDEHRAEQVLCQDPRRAVSWGSHRKKTSLLSAGNPGLQASWVTVALLRVPPSCCQWLGICRHCDSRLYISFLLSAVSTTQACLLPGLFPKVTVTRHWKGGAGRAVGTPPRSPSSVLSRKLPFLPWRKPSCFLQGGGLPPGLCPYGRCPAPFMSSQVGVHPCSWLGSLHLPGLSLQGRNPGWSCLLLPLSAPKF